MLQEQQIQKTLEKYSAITPLRLPIEKGTLAQALEGVLGENPSPEDLEQVHEIAQDIYQDSIHEYHFDRF